MESRRTIDCRVCGKEMRARGYTGHLRFAHQYTTEQARDAAREDLSKPAALDIARRLLSLERELEDIRVRSRAAEGRLREVLERAAVAIEKKLEGVHEEVARA